MLTGHKFYKLNFQEFYYARLQKDNFRLESFNG